MTKLKMNYEYILVHSYIPNLFKFELQRWNMCKVNEKI